MKTLVRILVLFLILSLASAVLTGWFGVEFGQEDYWAHHGVFFLIFLAVFPRLTLLFATSWGGIIWWLSWFIAPRLLVAVLATLKYWNANPILVVLAWLVALGGESAEKYVMTTRARSRGWG